MIGSIVLYKKDYNNPSFAGVIKGLVALASVVSEDGKFVRISYSDKTSLTMASSSLFLLHVLHRVVSI